MFRERKGFTTEDGHRYVSVPTRVPKAWQQWTDEDHILKYGSGDYLIIRRPYGKRFSYDLKRIVEDSSMESGFTLTDLGPAYSRLKDAKAHAVRNAQGFDVFNWA